jgi:ParB-like chromosome segregation protein Spo0J
MSTELASGTSGAGEPLWHRWLSCESLLKRKEVVFEERVIPLEAINWSVKDNRGRLIGERVDTDRVLEIAILLTDHEPMPMPVLNEGAPGRYDIVDGAHRCYAAREASLAFLRCYVVRIEDMVLLELLPTLFNQLNGVRNVEEELLLQASNLIDHWGWTIQDAVKEYRIRSEHALQTYRKIQAANKRLAMRGFRPEELTQAIRLKANTLTNDNVFAETVRLALRHGVTGDQFEEVHADIVRYGNTEADALRMVQLWNEKLTKSGKKQARKPDKPKYLNLLKQLKGLRTKLEKGRNRKGLQIATAAEVEELLDIQRSINGDFVRILGIDVGELLPRLAQEDAPAA